VDDSHAPATPGRSPMKRNTPIGGRMLDPVRYVFLRSPTSVQYRVLHVLGREAPWASGAPPVAPPPPADMRTGAPDFVGIGAAKSGTTWWFSLLMSHPEIHVEYDKELNYFNDQFLKRLEAGKVTLADAEAYRDWFPRPEGTITGEWTPHYAFAYRLPPVLRVAAPGAKLLVMLRDPVERYRSDLSRRMPSKALERLRFRSLANSMYANVLQPWEDLYHPDELLVLQFEACVRSPAKHLAETFRFLGVDDTFLPSEIRAPINTSKTKLGLDPFVVQQLVRLYAPDVLRLVGQHPGIDVSLWPNFAHLTSPPAFPAPPPA
jgi:Sulfotransferase domain